MGAAATHCITDCPNFTFLLSSIINNHRYSDYKIVEKIHTVAKNLTFHLQYPRKFGQNDMEELLCNIGT